MTMFLPVLSIERTKITRRSMFRVLLVLIAIIVLIIQLVLFGTYENGIKGLAIPKEERLSLAEAVTWPEALVNILTYTSGNTFGGLFFVILVGALTASEYTWRTMQLWLSRGVSRSLLIIAKFTVLLLPAMVLVVVAFIMGAFTTALTSVHINGTLNLDQLDTIQTALSVLRTACTLLPYGALTFFLAVVSRSTVVAIGGGLSYVLLFESLLMQLRGLLGEPLRDLVQFLPNRLSENLLVANQLALGVERSTTSGLDPWAAAIGIGCWTLLFLGLSLWAFMRQDLSQ
jgi:ABC-type transport system involved in multi-copper enzyme maturation permease subunit